MYQSASINAAAVAARHPVSNSKFFASFYFIDNTHHNITLTLLGNNSACCFPA